MAITYMNVFYLWRHERSTPFAHAGISQNIDVVWIVRGSNRTRKSHFHFARVITQVLISYNTEI